MTKDTKRCSDAKDIQTSKELVLGATRNLPDSKSGARQTLVRSMKGNYFVVSSVYAMFSGMETMVFPATKEGEVSDWGELWMSRSDNHKGGIEAAMKENWEDWD